MRRVETQDQQQRRSRWYEGCDLGLSGCDAPSCDGIGCDGCDACGGCDFMLGTLILGSMAISAPTRKPRGRTTGPGRAGMAAIRGYQRWLSPHLPTRCRQVPSCSNYGMEAVRRYGLVVGSRLIAARIRRCNAATPFGTLDQVP